MKLKTLFASILIATITSAETFNDFTCTSVVEVSGNVIEFKYVIKNATEFSNSTLGVSEGSGQLDIFVNKNGKVEKLNDVNFESLRMSLTQSESLYHIGYDSKSSWEKDIRNLNLESKDIHSFRLITPDYSHLPIVEYLGNEDQVIGRVALLDLEDNSSPYKICN
jgi:hypothetical protein